MKVLAIETSCDDTSLAIVSYDWTTFLCEHMVSFTQLEIHLSFGGVVPELASREHLDQILIVLQSLVQWCDDVKTLDELMTSIDAIVVTDTPWLPGSLIIWKTLASFLSSRYDILLLPVNHLHWHIFSFLLNRQLNILQDKNLILSVSWWHSDLSILSKNNNNLDVDIVKVWQYYIKKIGTTRDDAIGEVYDKISRLLWGPYPWWVWVSRQADLYEPTDEWWILPRISFKRIMLESWSFDFSFSGMKSQAYNFIEHYKKDLWISSHDILPDNIIQYICYEFQQAATDILVKKVFTAVECHHISLIALVGGVSANKSLREKMMIYKDQYNLKNGTDIQFYTPDSFDYCTDNAAMIGVAWIIASF